MGHTYTSLHYHIVFSTRGRRNLIPQDMLDRLHSYLGGIVTHLKGTPIAIGGTTDHVHVLATLPATLGLPQAVGKIKANSSKWAHDEVPSMVDFGWQEGYSAFTVSRSQVATVAAYIGQQMTHHAAVSFEAEFAEFLRRHAIEFDPRYVFD